jgi:hypothetical protein
MDDGATEPGTLNRCGVAAENLGPLRNKPLKEHRRI